MCGIAGYFSAQPTDIIHTMLDRLRHRGPDGDGIYFDKDRRLALGHKRLSILDLNNGMQPMEDATGSVIITYNGEIFNHNELRKELELSGYLFKTAGSDTEVILYSYLHWGKEFVHKLNGMFAFVLFDKRKNILFGARDRMGEKPLFFTHHRDGDFIFASELPSLLEHPKVSKSISLLEIQRYFAWGYSPGKSTLLENVYKLQSGHFFVYDLRKKSLHVSKYYEFQINVDDSLCDEQKLTEQLNTILCNAVERRAQSDVPVSAFLSGGIDSSLALAIYSEITQDKSFDTYTIGFNEKSFDESLFATQVANFLKFNNNLTMLDLDTAKLRLTQILEEMPEPLGDASVLPTYLLSENAATNYKVVLSGDGADELFGGYDPLIAMKFSALYQKLIPKALHNKIRSLAELLPMSTSYMSFDFKVKRALMGLTYKQSALLPIWMSSIEPREISELFQEPIHVDDLYAEAIEHWESRQSLSTVEKSLEFFTKFYLPDNILVKSDRTSMIHSLENRSVYLDNEVVEFVSKLPLKYKLNGTNRKYLLKTVAKRYLTKDIINRRKKGFGIPFSDWAKKQIYFENFDIGYDYNQVYFKKLVDEHKSNQKDRRLFLWAWYSLQKSSLMQKAS